MTTFVLSFFNSIIFTIYFYLSTLIIKKDKENNYKKIIFGFLELFLTYYIVLCLLESIYSVFFSALCGYFFIKVVFKENIFMSLFISVLINSTKIFIKIIMLILLNSDNLIINTYKTLALEDVNLNILSMLLSLIFIFIIKNPLKKIIIFISKSDYREIVLLSLLYINFIAVILYHPPFEIMSFQNVTHFIMIFLMTGMFIFNISSEKKMEDLADHYQKTYEYAKANGELLTNYKMQIHENKNKLLMIKGMLDEPKEEIIKYIDDILNEYNDNKNKYNVWLTELKYIPMPGIRNFMNYKLIKLKDLGAKIEIFISSDMEKLNYKSLINKEYNQLTTILGVIFDNMIDSIKENEEKLVSINIYIENDEVHGEFVNNFSGNINLERLNEIGYSTKGEKHGIGLALVAKIIKNNERFKCEPKIIDNFFVQHVTIKTYYSIDTKNKKNMRLITKK